MLYDAEQKRYKKKRPKKMMDWVGRLLTWLEPWLAYLLGLMQGSPLLALGLAVLAGVALGLSPITYLFVPAVVGYAGAARASPGIEQPD